MIVRLLVLSCMLCFSGESSSQDVVVPLWPDGIPCANDHEVQVEHSDDIGRRLSKVHAPDIAVFKAAEPNGTAVLICPGGGYAILAYDWEGVSIAKWFSQQGVTAIVLKNRLPHWENETCRNHVALSDAQQAMRMIRMHGSDWGINSDKIGVMGFSAGGHLASTLSTHYDTGDPSDIESLQYYSSKPDFSILIYPVITMDTSFTHMGSRNNLIGRHPSKVQEVLFSNELQITKDTPPALLVHASDDTAVPVENSIRYYQGLIRKGVAASLLIYESGGHGFGMAKHKEGAVSHWLEDCKAWLIERSLISAQ